MIKKEAYNQAIAIITSLVTLLILFVVYFGQINLLNKPAV